MSHPPANPVFYTVLGVLDRMLNPILDTFGFLIKGLSGVKLQIVSSTKDAGTAHDMMEYIGKHHLMAPTKVCVQGHMLPYDWVLGWGYLAKISMVDGSDDFWIEYYSWWIYTSAVPKSLDAVITYSREDDIDIDIVRQLPLASLERTGHYNNISWIQRTRDLKFLESRDDQTAHAQSILDGITKGESAVLVVGPAGCGKSKLGYLVAAWLGGIHVNSHNPTDPGDWIVNLIDRVRPTAVSPLVLVFDEWDTVVSGVINGTIHKHHKYVKNICDKSTYTGYMDNLHETPHVFSIYTSNQTRSWWETVDQSYWRKGRIDRIVEWGVVPD